MRRLLLCMPLLVASACRAASPAEVFAQAEASFQRGLERIEAGLPGAARLDFEQAALAFDRVTTGYGVDSPALRTNAGNAWLLAGRTGEAALAYRRALRLDPAHAPARAGLAEARARTGVEIPVAPARRVSDRAVGVLGALGPARLLWIGAAAWTCAWVIVGLCALGPAGPWARPIATVCAGAGLILIGAVAWASWLQSAPGEAVILADQVEARLGPGAAAYEPAFDTPLVAGMEVHISNQRDGWAEVSLLDGRSGWLPESALALVRPGA